MIRLAAFAILVCGPISAQPHFIASVNSLAVNSDGLNDSTLLSQSATITSSDGSAVPFTAALSSESPLSIAWQTSWSGFPTTPATFKISCQCVNRAAGTFTANVGIYTVPMGGGQAPSLSIPITITVVPPPPPAITSIVNAASFGGTGQVAPGEILSIFGSGLGPNPALSADLSQGKTVPTQLGNVAVIFYDGCCREDYAPILYAGATQVNILVPYDVSGWSQAFLQLGAAGGNVLPTKPNVTNVAVAPGIFTGASGQAAALNQDSSVNSSANPAPAGSIVQLFMTGEGQTSPPGVTGSITCANGCSSPSQIPKPVATVTATINGQPATVEFAGEAPSLVAGVLQVNLLIPAGTPSGNAPVVVNIGSGSSQAGVTIAVK